MLLIGSKALQLQNPFLTSGRKIGDLDVICTFQEYDSWTKSLPPRNRKFRALLPIPYTNKFLAVMDDEAKTKIEFEIAWPNSNAERLLYLVEKDPLTLTTTHNRKYARNPLEPYLPVGVKVASVECLYALKMSHRYLKDSPHFLKTLNDCLALRTVESIAKRNNAIHPLYAEWFKERERDTYRNKLPKLNQSKQTFFSDDGIQYIYDHDSIHVAMAHLEHPAYTYYLKEGAEVQCDRELFFSLPQQTRLYGVLEETYVLALERSQIPFKGKVDPRRSFEIALQKVCTSITGGWFREFAWENYHRVVSMYNPAYVEKFWKAVEDGVVKKLPETA